MPFDSARSPQFEAADGPDLARTKTALARFTARHPYLLFHHNALPGIRRSAAANPKLQARAIRILTEIPAPPPAEPRAALKRRARRLIAALAAGGGDDERHHDRDAPHDGRAKGSATRKVVPAPRFDS